MKSNKILTPTRTVRAEYLWLDGSEPVSQLRSKTKIIKFGEDPPVWGFDGSSTEQAEGGSSDCVLRPVFLCSDPIRGEDNILVLCEVLDVDMRSHSSNTRNICARTEQRFSNHEMWFGIEQEYTLFRGDRPMGWPKDGFPAVQGPYYCGVGADRVFGRKIVEEHMNACLAAGLKIGGINAEVMPGQWEFQIGPLPAVEVSDQLWIARWLLHRIAENHDVVVSLDPKPMAGDWNGAGAHTNFSTRAMREDLRACWAASNALRPKHEEHIAGYGAGIERRLTGLHETCDWREFRDGVSDRGASIRIPWQVARDRRGYVEDRRPCANIDPYVVTCLILQTVCHAETRIESSSLSVS